MDGQSILSDLTNMDLSEVSTSRPLLAPCAVECTVGGIEIKESSKGGHYLSIRLRTQEPAPKFGSEDEEIPAGYDMFTNLSITPTAKYDPLPNLARFMESTKGEKGNFGDVEDYVGLECMVKIKVRDSEDYGPQNDVAFLKKA